MADAEAYDDNNFEPQLAAIKHYCKAKLDANPETRVALFTMASYTFRFWHLGTSDFQQILDSLPSIGSVGGCLRFRCAIDYARFVFRNCPPNKQKRMLFLTASFVDLDDIDAVEYGMKLKDLGIAVDVVNFHLGIMLEDTTLSNQFGRTQLDAFVDNAKSNDNSHIEHVEPGSSIRRVLSKSILRDTLRLSGKTNHHEKETRVKLGKRKRNHHKKAIRVKLCKRKRRSLMFNRFNVFSLLKLF